MPRQTNVEVSVWRRRLVFLAGTLFFIVGMLMILGSSMLSVESPWHDIVSSTGSFLTVTLLLGFLYKALVSDIDDARLADKLTEVFDEKLDKTFASCATFGLAGFEPEINFEKIFDSLGPRKTLWWLDTYDPNHRSWHDNLRQAVGKGARVKFLVIDPESPLIDMRAAELGADYPKVFRSDLETFLVSLKAQQTDAPKVEGKPAIEIVKYRDLPCAPIYVIEESGVLIEAYSGHFLGRATAVKFPHQRWRPSDEPYINYLYDYVKEKWERNKPHGYVLADQENASKG